MDYQHRSNTPEELRDRFNTPREVFYGLKKMFPFELDVAASSHNALCEKFIDKEQDSLNTDWNQFVSKGAFAWCNPPYSKIKPWVDKAGAEAHRNKICTVMLVPSDTSGEWYSLARYLGCAVWQIIGGYAEKGRWHSGRISFLRDDTKEAVKGNPKGSMLLIFDPYMRYRDRDITLGYIIRQGERHGTATDLQPQKQQLA